MIVRITCLISSFKDWIKYGHFYHNMRTYIAVPVNFYYQGVTGITYTYLNTITNNKTVIIFIVLLSELCMCGYASVDKCQLK